jgi:hypothetical protein
LTNNVIYTAELGSAVNFYSETDGVSRTLRNTAELGSAVNFYSKTDGVSWTHIFGKGMAAQSRLDTITAGHNSISAYMGWW